MQCLIHGNGLNFQKRFTVKDLWGEQSLLSSKGEIKLPDVIAAAKTMGYNENTTMYEILFANKKS